MRVILLKSVPKLGQKGDVVMVKDGHGLNYLIPGGFARMATEAGVAVLHAQNEHVQKKQSREQSEHVKIKKNFEGKTLEIKAKANTSGTLFAAVHTRDIIEAVRTQLNVTLLEMSLKTLPVMKKVGEYNVGVKLGGDVEFRMRVIVKPSS